jgi:hypothetical protein
MVNWPPRCYATFLFFKSSARACLVTAESHRCCRKSVACFRATLQGTRGHAEQWSLSLIGSAVYHLSDESFNPIMRPCYHHARLLVRIYVITTVLELHFSLFHLHRRPLIIRIYIIHCWKCNHNNAGYKLKTVHDSDADGALAHYLTLHQYTGRQKVTTTILRPVW